MGHRPMLRPSNPFPQELTPMSQQSTKTDPTVTAIVSTPLVPLVERLNALMQDVRDMPRGGDLEGLIGTHLDGLRRECCDIALEQRQQAAGQPASDTPEAFPPSALPAVPGAAAPRTPQAAHDPDPAR